MKLYLYIMVVEYQKNTTLKKHDIILFYSVTDKYFFKNEKKPYSELSSPRLLHKHRNKKSLEELNEGTPVTDVWNDLKFKINYKEEEYVGYKTQKPKALIERIIKASSNENDIVADFYMGSGTSMEVAKELNRKYIGCDISQKAVNITNNRLARQEAEHKLF